MHLAPARRLKWPPFARLPAFSFIFQLSCSQLPAAGCLSSALSCRPAVLPSALSCPVLPGWPDYSSASQLSLCLASKLSPFTLLQLLLLLQQFFLLPLLLPSLLIHRLAIVLARRFIWIIVMIYTEVAVATFGVQLRLDLARLGNELRRGLRV